MKKIIKKILSEQRWFENYSDLPESALEKIYKFFDKIGLEEGIPLLHLDDYEKEVDAVLSYYWVYGGDWSVDVPVTFYSSTVAQLFNDDIEKLVENFLDGNYEYDSHYECYSYDHYWMWDNINEENQKYILEKAKEAGIDIDDESELKEFISDEYGSDIGCAFADAQQSADIDALHTDIIDQVNDLFTEFNGKWDFETGQFNGTIPFIELTKSEFFRDALEDNLLNRPTIEPAWITESIVESEWDEIAYGNETTLFPNVPYINTDRHFRYGGAGDMDEGYMNEILSDRLSWN